MSRMKQTLPGSRAGSVFAGFALILHERLHGVGKAGKQQNGCAGKGNADAGLCKLSIFRLGQRAGGRGGLSPEAVTDPVAAPFAPVSAAVRTAPVVPLTPVTVVPAFVPAVMPCVPVATDEPPC